MTKLQHLFFKHNLFKAAKHHFKRYPNGSISLDYENIDPKTGCIGVTIFKYKDFKFEYNYAQKNNINIIKFTFKTI